VFSRFGSAVVTLAVLLFLAASARAQSPSPDGGDAADDSSSLPVAPTSALDPFTADAPIAPSLYVPPTETQKFHDYAMNAVGPIAFAGSAFAAAINQASDFPHKWGQGADAFSARLASNLGISVVTATAQYSLAEAFHEDTKYYRCACTGFFPRLWHAAVSSVASRRGEYGDTSFSVALTASPFIGPMAAATLWIPAHNVAVLGFRMGTNNMLGQFAQNEALEFLYGGPHTLLGHIEHRFFRKSFDARP